jgi:hypothetical protein
MESNEEGIAPKSEDELMMDQVDLCFEKLE